MGETAFEWYGTQFPVLVKRLQVKGRSSLHVNPDDETAEQRYDAFGKTALWYVEAAGPDARLFLGFKRPVSAESFYKACLDGTVEELLQVVRPKAGERYLIRPGLVHAAQDVTLLEVAEASELWFRLYDWGATERELHLEEAFDLIDLQGKTRALPGKDAISTDQFTVNVIPVSEALRCQRDAEDTFLLYVCVSGAAVLQSEGVNYNLKPGELVLVPAEVTDFFLLPAQQGTELLEVRMDPREDTELKTEEEEA